MKFTDKQLALFKYLESLGFDKHVVKSGSFDPDFVTIVARGSAYGEEVTYKINLRTEGN